MVCTWWVNWPGKVSLTQSAVMLGLRVRGRGGRDRTPPVAAPISAFLWGSTPFLCARAKKWGGTGSRGGIDFYPRRRRTRNRANEVLPCLWLCACAPIRWEVDCSFCCRSTPFLWCLPKETVSSRQRKAPFYPGGSTIRVSAPASVDGGHLRPTWGRAGAGRGLGAGAPIRWEGGVSLPCLSTPFLWCLPKETVSSRQRKALFYPGVSTIRVSATSR